MNDLVFLTGGTGFLGSYVLDHYLRETDCRIVLLTRAKNRQEGIEKLWKALQIHQDASTFWQLIDRVEIAEGDLTKPNLGLKKEIYQRIVQEADSILHIAASLNRKSEKACMNHNLRGTLSMLKLARAVHAHHGLRRFSFVSTTAVAGKRNSETVHEDESIEWDRSDYDPYARTKKFCEHMIAELLPDVPYTIFRPATVMGDSRHPRSTQFEMVRAFNTVFSMPFFPIRPEARVDIVNGDWVGRAIFQLHRGEAKHNCYHLSSGTAAPTAREIADAMATIGRRPPIMVPKLLGVTQLAFDSIAGLRARNTFTYVGSLFKVFLPYITFDTVFDNRRAVEELGEMPTSFLQYGPAFAQWCKEQHYSFPYEPLPKQKKPMISAQMQAGAPV